MSRTPRRPASLRRRVFRAATAIERGLITRRNLRSRAWRRLFRGVYADSSIEDTHGLRCVAAAAYVLPTHAAIAGRSAATLFGARMSGPADPVEVLVPPGQAFGPVAGLVVHAGPVDDGDVQVIDRVRVTRPVRTCWDVAVWLDVVEAVVVIDRLLALRRVTMAALVAYAAMRAPRRGWRRFRRALALADGRSESPQESRLRVRLTLVGLPPPEVQYTVYSRGRFIARVDLAWPDLKIAVEYDGVWHVGSAPQMHRDRARLNRLAAEGWTIIFATSKRMGPDFDEFVTELRTTIRQRS